MVVDRDLLWAAPAGGRRRGGVTHRGRQLQLRPLSVALLEELTGHQLSNLESHVQGVEGRRRWLLVYFFAQKAC